MISNIKELISKAEETPTLKLAVAAAGDPVVLQSVKKADEKNIIEPILVGDQDKIEDALQEIDYGFNGEIIAVNSQKEAADKTISLISSGDADFPMKGLISTRTILKSLLDRKYNLRQDRLLSLVTLMYLEKEERIVLMSDGGMNIAPELKEKKQILENTVEIAQSLGIEKPKAAPIAAVENVNSSMPDTMDAAVLSKMADRGQIEGAIVDGPLALDNAISMEAAKHKGIESPVAGQADILLMPDIEAGNVLYKSLVFYSQLESASLVYGAKVPVVLTSRADRMETKFNSIALGKLATMGMDT